MMKKILLFLILTISLSITSCTTNTTTFEQDSYANAYLSSIEYMFNSDDRDDGVSILAFDYSNVEIEETEMAFLKSRIQELCDEREQTYLEATMDELIQMEYIELYELENGTFIPNAFPDGALIRISTVSTEENVVVADMSIWRGSLSAYGSTYTTTYTDGSWEVTVDGFWIS